MIKLLVATDLSQRSAHALQRAAQLIRKQGGGDWALVHVVDDDAPKDFVAEHVQRVERLLAEQAQQLAEQTGSRPRVLVSSGEVEAIIFEACLGMDADLLVVGCHRKTPLRDFFLGSSVERLIRGSHLPVLRVAQPVVADYRQVLAALDLSPGAVQAMTRAQRLGLLDPQHCTAVYAQEPFPLGLLTEAAIDQRLLESQTEEALLTLLANLHDAGLSLPDGCVRVQEGQPRQVIAQALQQRQADLLVIATHERKGLPRLVLGSVAGALLAELACDILCVPPPG
ncbi:universal stress protein [Pseudomonas sp. sp1636]|uniref:universal stress protein n=1 Tax=Pseudomonas sp. sp1636 TaxID=3036707 RepID=UPI0025A61F72|nr:universal stress protein [Pseudomonas sp. sp1636]MDM8347313.1 universal stress protein [Pseudomonas sp. sp1636]